MDNQAKCLIEEWEKCDAFFKEALDKAMGNQCLRISDLAEFYILTLLVAGHNKELSENAKESDADKDTVTETFARALASSNHRALRDVGDRTLVLTGIWWPSLSRKSNNVDFYISMGRRSYAGAGESKDSLSELFNELAEKFIGIVSVLTEATQCIYETSADDTDILRIYKVWQKTHNPFLEQKLKSLGIRDLR